MKPKVAHNTHTRASKGRIYAGLEELPLIEKSVRGLQAPTNRTILLAAAVPGSVLHGMQVTTSDLGEARMSISQEGKWIVRVGA